MILRTRPLLDRLEGVPDEKRTARFVCAIAAALPDGSAVKLYRGTMEGIVLVMRSQGRMDSAMIRSSYLPECGCSSAELCTGEEERTEPSVGKDFAKCAKYWKKSWKANRRYDQTKEKAD